MECLRIMVLLVGIVTRRLGNEWVLLLSAAHREC